MRVCLVLGAVLALLGSGACGDDGESAPDGAESGATADSGSADTESVATISNACSLLTVEEVEAAGVKASRPQPADSATGFGCNYGDDPSEEVTVIIQPGGGQPFYDQRVALFSSPKPLSGLGDQAVVDTSNPQQTSVVVLQSDTVLSVGGSISSEDAQSLAEKALARLGA